MAHNETHTIEIQKLVEKGFGLGFIHSKPVFVAKTVPQDIVEIRIYKKLRKRLFGKVINTITPSPLRGTKQCEHFPQCGGCHYQDISYADQLNLKLSVLRDTIEHHNAAIGSKLAAIVGCDITQYHRNKMEFAFGYNNNQLICGLKEQGTFDNIIPITDCKLLAPLSNDIVAKTAEFFQLNPLPVWDSHQETGCLSHLMLRHSKQNDTYVVSLIAATKDPLFLNYATTIMQQFPAIIGVNHLFFTQKKGQPSTVTCINLKGQSVLQESINGLRFNISPQAFFQTNSYQVGVLYDIVKQCCDLKPTDTLLDLYCGTGTIGIYVCHKQGQLIGIEEVPQAIEDAKKNAQLNNMTNTTFIAGRVKNILKFNTFNVDCVVIDPPRSGMVPKALQRVIDLRCKKIVYVSCNPITLLRDLDEFIKQGYHIDTFIPVDMFPHSYHLECVVKLTLN